MLLLNILGMNFFVVGFEIIVVKFCVIVICKLILIFLFFVVNNFLKRFGKVKMLFIWFRYLEELVVNKWMLLVWVRVGLIFGLGFVKVKIIGFWFIDLIRVGVSIFVFDKFKKIFWLMIVVVKFLFFIDGFIICWSKVCW